MVENAALKRMVRNRPRRVSGVHDVIGQTVPKVALRQTGVEVGVEKVTVSATTLSDVLDGLDDDTACWRLEQEDTGGLGLCLVDLSLRSSLIEVLTTGGITPNTPISRKATAIDCRLLSHAIDAWIAEIAAALDRPPLWCVRSGARLDGAREIEHCIEDASFERVDIAIRFSNATRAGRLCLVLRPETAAARTGAFTDRLRASLLSVPREITVVASRERVSLSKVAGLKPGDVLRLPGLNLDRVSVEAPIGRTCCNAVLGQSRGFRAIKIGDAGVRKLAEMPNQADTPAPVTLDAERPLPTLAPLGDQD